MAAKLRLADLLGGLSLVADSGYGLAPGHAMRSCLVGVALARRIGLAEHEVADTFYTSLLAHVGCAAFSHEMSAAFGDELTANRAGARTNFADPKDVFTSLIPESTRGLPPLGRVRTAAFIVARGRGLGRRYDSTVCEIARETARRIDLASGVQRALFQVKEAWNGSGHPRRLKGDQILFPARIARVASEATLFHDLGGVAAAVRAVSRRGGSLLDPAIVAEFLGNAAALLGEAGAGDPRERVMAAEPEPVVEKPEGDLPLVAAAFGDLVDLKTPFTHGHSKEVAGLAKAAAERLGFDAEAVRRLHVAAFLHDLGKVGISDLLWEKQGPLTGPDWEQVRMHAYHGERILATSRTLEPMARTAGMHHERLDGSGYHRGCRAPEIPPAARVLAAADAFQAMTQQRPHRDALDPEQAAGQLRAAAKSGKLDHDAVAAVVEAAGQRVGRRRELRPGGLSNREIEVLRLLARACSNREIGERLHISPRTAEHHVQHTYAKIGVTTRSAAALFALEHDLLPAKDA
ncbi:HD domain-containing phosphohydrolase [Saccharothrix deserti]|uniref:HD domain-containing phosphohydrolase n=1 Tax=Saccharothrix deserti TaxID=2593674 RepID=UPI00131B551B|nr:HD domain-containing phosphohydrolase [Saccharothrix deserti]